MTNDIFYAIVKLVSGEELLSKVGSFLENDEVLVVLDHPIIVELLMNTRMKSPVVKVQPWIQLSTQTTYVINRDKILTMTEIKEPNLIEIHEKYVSGLNSTSKHSKISPEMGYVSSVKEARRTLEEIYQRKEANSNFD